ncbi:MAG: heavy metal translocating P-type ATPase [Balneolaceae bacterium]
MTLDTNDQHWTKGRFRVEGMHCTGCSGSVEKALTAVDGTRHVEVNLAAEQASLDYNRNQVTVDELMEAVRKAGYQLIPTEDESDRLAERQERENRKLKAARRNLIVAWLLTGPVMAWMALEMTGILAHGSTLVMESVMTLAAAAVLFIPGRKTLVSARRSAVNLNPNMDVLISIGTLAALSTGLVALAHHLGWMELPFHSFAGVAAMIMAFHLTGRYIETKARGRTSDAITKLLTLEAETATVIRNGEEAEVSAQEIRPGDVIRVRPGGKVPVDGEVIQGSGSLNESFITGESMPTTKSTGDPVIGGTILEEGSLKIRAVHVGRETYLNRVVRLVEEAQNTKVPVQEYVDHITTRFVPAVLLLSLFTFLIWASFPSLFTPLLEWANGIIPWIEPSLGRWGQAFYAALAVLVIACPCALGLATPTALMVGSGLGAGNGILIRKGEAIQRLQESKTMVFDKTGTLTEGRPDVTDFINLGSRPDNELLSLIRAAEYPSEHPISRAVVRYTESVDVANVEAARFRSSPGLGVHAVVDGREILVGNPALIQREKIPLTDEIAGQIESLESLGKTVVIAAVDREAASLIALSDRIKPDAREALQWIQEQGFRTVLLTGDNQRVADAIGRELGFDEILAGVLPDQKADAIEHLQQDGQRVVMVGDGVNDAPALAKADVGIAIGTGTDIAIEAGSIILVQGNLRALVKAVVLSRATFQKIRQNLFWAFFYNVVMIPVAMAGWMHPVLAEAAMAFSSISVVGNSSRLSSNKLGR